jgi:hypothetical protein
MNIKNDAPYGVRAPAEIPEFADRLLAEYFQIIYSLGIKGAIVFGICLGFYRDGAYLAVDNDLDVAALVDSLERTYLTKRLIDYGYLMGRTYPKDNTHFVKIEGENRVLLDVNWRKAEGYYAELGSVPYKSTAYPIPMPVEEYLERCYGPGWRVDDPNNDGMRIKI